jgi:betaine-aldehyde dehydrogenase
MTAPAAPTTAPTVDVFAPADGSLVAIVPDSLPADVAATVRALRAHQPTWEALGARGRASWLRRYGRWIRAHQTELATLLQSETGKPLQEARLEIALALDLLDYCARNAARFLAERHPRPHGLLTAARS